MVSTEVKKIGKRGYSYHCTQMGALQGGRVFVRLAKMLNGVAAPAMKAVNGEWSPEVIAGLFKGLLANISESDYDYLCEQFLGNAMVSGGQFKGPVPLADHFDQLLAGEYVELGQWILFSLRVNFGSFLAGAGEGKTTVQVAMSPPASPAAAAASA